MEWRITQDIRVVSQILEFERLHMKEAKTKLEHKYGVPQSDSFNIANRIFKKMCNISVKITDINRDKLWHLFDQLAIEDVKHIKSLMSKNFNLTEKEFDAMKARMLEGDETLFEHVFIIHIDTCISFLKRKYKLQQEDAYDYSMDALIEFRSKLLQSKIRYGNLRFLLTQMASQVYLKAIKDDGRKKEVTSIFDDVSNEEHFQLIEKAFEDLGEACQELLKLNFYEKLNLKSIAELKGKTAVSIRKQKQRCVFALKNAYLKFSNQL